MLRIPDVQYREEADGQTLSPASRIPRPEPGGGRGSSDRDQIPPPSAAEEEMLRRKETAGHILDLAIVKDLITDLHEEGDAQLERYAAYSGREIADIAAHQREFAKGIQAKYLSLLKEDRQKSLFLDMSAWYFRRSLEQAETLQTLKAEEYAREVVERQNTALLARALRRENIGNDKAVSTFRDLILRNLETLSRDLPAGETQALLDRASRTFAIRVLERRLELNPSSMLSMLRAKAVRRVLGEELADEYLARMRQAAQDDTMARLAEEWCEEGISLQEAENRAGRRWPTGPHAARLLEDFGSRRQAILRKEVVERLDRIDRVWRVAVEGGATPDAIPVAIRRSERGLASYLCTALRERSRHGGMGPDPDYRAVAGMGEDCRSGRLVERLADERTCYRYLARLGCPDSRACACARNLVACQMDERDTRWLEDMGRAKRYGEGAANFPPPAMRDYLHRFNAAREVRLIREGGTGLDPRIVTDICRDLVREENSGQKT